ncbi:hypothetical protein ACFPES_32910 [Paenibacillus sp. GCM10023248]|uniref:hypothetical protein n=1 Tax=Bacillales TaxID=1385 RepID=UPI0023795AB8|nr:MULTISPECIES: hypothetical protein [Bacillales]MDD9271841.1 hypothetical protein [Paenibacillus sp. MAHUQ-63]MDR6883437.1 hypothetical protein [Bacillus sp. 3255]
MLFAAEAAATTSTYTAFDIYVLIFTVIIALGVIRQVVSPKRNLFALGFGTVALLVFIFMDYVMISGW